MTNITKEEVKNMIDMALVTYDPNAIFRIEDPSEEVQLKALSGNTGVFRNIKNPTEKVQEELARINPYAINLISNKSKRITDIANAEIEKLEGVSGFWRYEGE